MHLLRSRSSTATPFPASYPMSGKGLGVDPDADDQWENDANWSLGIAPLRLSNPYVCIPAGGMPVIGAGQEAQLVALDVAADGELKVESGGKLFLYGGCVDALDDPRARGRRRGHVRRAGPGGRVRHAEPAQPWPVRPGNHHHARVRLLPGPYRLGEELCIPGLPIIGAKGRIVVDDEGVVDVSGGKVNLG